MIESLSEINISSENGMLMKMGLICFLIAMTSLSIAAQSLNELNLKSGLMFFDLKNYRNNSDIISHRFCMNENSLSYRRSIKTFNANDLLKIGVGIVHFYDFNSSGLNTPTPRAGINSFRDNFYYSTLEFIFSKKITNRFALACMIDGNFTSKSLLYYRGQKSIFIDGEISLNYKLNKKYSIYLGCPLSIIPMLKYDVNVLPVFTSEWRRLAYRWNKLGISLSMSVHFYETILIFHKSTLLRDQTVNNPGRFSS